jgi:hypothetical protein|tara:strand:- start:83 stop:232 length:150 start_codon:yes stop_codon:yes gene_type:complete
MKNLPPLDDVDYQMLNSLVNKQGMNMKTFISTLINNLYTEMKRTGRKPL